MILFSGAIKTANYAQDRTNVKDHFKIANQLTTAIDTAIKEKDIRWIDDYTDIDFEDNLLIDL